MRRSRRVLRPQPFEIVEFAYLGPEYVHDHIAGIDQHPVAIGQALDMDAFDAGFLQGFGHVFRDRADMPVGPACGDDHVVGKGGFAAKVDGDRFFRLHIVEAGEDHIQRLVGVGLRLQGRSFGRCFTRGFCSRFCSRLLCRSLGNLGQNRLGQYRCGQGPFLSLYRERRILVSTGYIRHVGLTVSIFQLAPGSLRPPASVRVPKAGRRQVQFHAGEENPGGSVCLR